MKRKVSFGIAVLMILATCLFVSCNSEVSTTAQVNDGKLVYATFDKMSKAIRPSSSSMTISYELDNIDDLYWVYTATKTDGAGTTGQTDGTRVPGDTTTHKGLGGAIGPFSKGTWTFTVEGYKYTGASTEIMDPSVETLRESTDFNLIYVGTADGVVLNVTNTSDNPEPINITVYLQTQGGTGTLKIAANSKFFWAATGEGGYALEDLKLKVYDGETLKDKIDLTGYASEGEGHAVYYSNANDTSINGLASGDHVFKVQVVRTVGEVDQVFFEGTVNAKIYAGITTALDTQAIEGLFTYAQFNGTIDDSAVVVVATDTATTTSAGNVEFATNYTPASGINPSTDKKTTVSISGDESTISVDATYDLGVETSNIIAAGSKFSVASDSTAVASVDLTLTKTEGSTTTTVSDFGAGAATVTTYIAKSLSGVAFFYENTPFTKVETEGELGVDKFYYEGSTGKLVFMTSHFSEFYVTSTDEAYNATKVKAHTTLQNAVDNAADNDEIILLKDINYGTDGYLLVNKTIDLNLNNKSITGSHDPMIVIGASVANYKPKESQMTHSGHLSIRGEGLISSNNWDMICVFPDAVLDVYSGNYIGNKASFYISGGNLNTYGGYFTSPVLYVPPTTTSNYIVQVKNAGIVNIIAGEFYTPEYGCYGVYLDYASVSNFGSETGVGPTFNTWRPCIATNGSESHGVTANIYSGTYRAYRSDDATGENNTIQFANNKTTETQTLNIYGGTFEQAGSNEDRSIFNVRYNGTININVNGGTFVPVSSTSYFNGVGSPESGWPTTGNVHVTVTNSAIPSGIQEVKVYDTSNNYMSERCFEITI